MPKRKIDRIKAEDTARMMRTIAALLASLTIGACTTPVQPDTLTVPTVRTCLTQPRLYWLPDGTVSIEVDRYESIEPCPIVPID